MRVYIEKDDKIEFSVLGPRSKFYSLAFLTMSINSKLYIEINSNLINDFREPNSLTCDIDHIMNFSDINTDWEFVKNYIEFKKQLHKRLTENHFMAVTTDVYKEKIKNILKEMDIIENKLKPEVQLFILAAN